MPSPRRTSSDSPLPSFTLQITQKDAQRFVKASRAIELELDSRQATLSGPLHERYHDAATKCQDRVVASFLDRLGALSLPLQERKAGILVLSKLSRSDKLGHLWAAFSHNSSQTLARQGILSLLRSVLAALTCCTHTASDFTPDKDVKTCQSEGGETVSTTKDASDLGTPSFDSSLATLKDEDDLELRREIEEICQYATDKLVQEESITLAELETWYNRVGHDIVPWFELLDSNKWRNMIKSSDSLSLSPASLLPEDGNHNKENDHADTSRTLVSFDFTGTLSSTASSAAPLCVHISQANILALEQMVNGTGLAHCLAADLCKKLLAASIKINESLVLTKSQFLSSLEKDLVAPDSWIKLPASHRKTAVLLFGEIFALFSVKPDQVNLQEFATGLAFFCAGNKSTKLATGFEMLDHERSGALTHHAILRYLQSYLTMLVAMSLLTPLDQKFHALTAARRQTIRLAVESGAKWTLEHFSKQQQSNDAHQTFSFETFATWYSTGGFHIAPWLELLDLKKVLSLLTNDVNFPPSPHPMSAKRPPPSVPSSTGPPPPRSVPPTERPKGLRDRVSTLRRHHSSRRGPPPEILFTFPLASHRSLIVLRDDATYVRDVVEQLGLLHLQPDAIWSSLHTAVDEAKTYTKKDDGTVYVDQRTFTLSMQSVCPKLASRKRNTPGGGSSADELLQNFFQCFDLDQIDSVAMDELMGGLMLLCGGKKSTKLAFAFGIFDTRPGMQQKRQKKESVVHSLSGEDLFLFLRSILIVTFSCCRQSLDMTDQMVGRCIADTANMICNDVMRHQWEIRKLDRLNFDEFGQWYNDGGFERAPWLELLDLKKWVLIDEPNVQKQLQAAAPVPLQPVVAGLLPELTKSVVPPPPPDDAFDSTFFDDHGIMPMDSVSTYDAARNYMKHVFSTLQIKMDDMDMIFMNPSSDKDELRSPRARLLKSWSFSPGGRSPQASPRERRNPLKFLVVTDEKSGGYMLSLSNRRIRNLRGMLESCKLHLVPTEELCNAIMAKASKSSQPKLSRDGCVNALHGVLSGAKSKNLLDVLVGIYDAFDVDGAGKVNPYELAAGFTVLCSGKKSDKLEFAFELLDKKRKGQLSQDEMKSYIRSFLTVLMCIAFSPALANDSTDDTISTMKGGYCERNNATIMQAVHAGADWATAQAIRCLGGELDRSVSFDEFADWYTTEGHRNIPWLELLDMRKWVFTAETV